MVETLFWLSFLGILYAYLLYPVVLYLWGKLKPRPLAEGAQELSFAPEISIIMPLHNEAHIVADKLRNLAGLDYPLEAIELVVVSDGSTDNTVELVSRFQQESPALKINLLEINDRKGKANALNHGVGAATKDFLVFTDASIMLEKSALKAIIAPFLDPAVGCVSGEDHIPDG